jgi:carbon starvation protein CstA
MAMENFYKIVGAVLAPFRYAQREIENAKESLKEEAHDAASNVLKIIGMVFCTLFFLLFGSIAAAAAINSSLDNSWLGFAIVAFFYLAVTIGIYVWKNATNKKKHAQEYHRDNSTRVTT